MRRGCQPVLQGIGDSQITGIYDKENWSNGNAVYGDVDRVVG